MLEREWAAAWGVICGSWPTGKLSEPTVRAEWRAHFLDADLDDLVGAVRRVASQDPFPSIAAVAEEYQAIHTVPPPPAPPVGLADAPREIRDWTADYWRLPEEVRAHYLTRWPGLGKDSTLRHLLVVKEWEFNGERLVQPAPAEDSREWGQSVARVQRQLAHERNCAACAAYAQPSPTQDRYGEPCPIGRRYWGAFYRLNGNRWNTPRAETRRKTA